MTTYEVDPEGIRWGLQFVDVCSLSNNGALGTITHYDKDLSRVESVTEYDYEINHINVENDEVIAHSLQEELSRVADAQAFGSFHDREEHQHWLAPLNSHAENEGSQEEECERAEYSFCYSPGEKSVDGDDPSCSPEVADEFSLDGEAGKRMNQMVPVPHVPKINGEIPSVDEETSDHQRLMDRLQLYDLVELKVLGDGNCQFRSVSDQIYRSTEHHTIVREQIIDQLKSNPELYEGYVPMAFDAYLKKISKTGEWGDHVTLQAAADAYGVKILVITSFKDTCYIEILPHVQISDRIIFLSFWAEVHYNSIYRQGDLPLLENKKKKWWSLGS